MGQYGVYVEKGERRYEAGEFKVQQFKVPLMKAAVKPLSETLVNTTKVDVDVMAEYLSGGGAKGLPIKLRAQAEPKEVTFEDYDQYSFSRGAVKEGIKRRGSESPSDYPDESVDEEEEAIGWSQRYSRHGRPVKTLDLTLGEGGMARAAIDGIPRSSVPLDLFTEMEFKDPNGKVVTVSKTIPIWPSGVAVGLQTDDWVVHKNPLKVKALVLDLAGKPMANLPVTVTLFQKKIYSHRKKLLGGFYAYENSQEIKKSAPGCEGTTNAQGLLFCEIENPPAGSLLVEARAADKKGNVAATNTEVWVTGREEMWFDASSSDRIDLIPDKQRYEPGENALFQVRMPMREATALITVEREGIIDSFVTRLSGTNPSVEVPIKGSYAPNVFVSALCVRGRTGEGKPTAFLDLAKPTFKLGIAGVSVGWRTHELKVGVASDKKVYKIREKARFSVKVQTADGRPVPAGSEVAFAVVDDGLLELMQNESWNILEHMMQKRGYSVATSTAQMQVVGRRHYGLKAIPFGGGGGRQITRELFDTLLLWKGSLALDEKGEAFVEVPLNDALTSFTAVAVATGAADLFGTGRTHIQSTQDLMILSGLSDVVREGDQFKAVFTLRNTSDHEVATETKARVTLEKGVIDLPPLKESLKAGEAREIGWNLTVPVGAGSMKWEIAVTDSEGTARDSLKVTQRAVPALEISVVQASVAQLDKMAQFTVERPKEAIPGKGGIKLSLTPKLSESVSGIIDYMSSYPYVCLEQRLSKAVALGDKPAWQQIMKVLPGYMDNDGLLKYFPTMEKGDDILTSYFIAIGSEAGWETPPELLTRVKEGLQKFLEGKTRRESPLSRPDLTIRKIAAIEALCRLEPGNARYLQTIDIQPLFWPTSAVLDWTSILKRADDIPGREGRLKEAEQIIRSRLNFQGTRMGFSTERNDYLWWLMVNGDVNAVRTILTFLDDPAWIEDMPRLVRGATGRQEKGRWWSTVANAWGRLALGKFSDSFEAAKVEGVTSAQMGGQSQTLDWKAAPAGKTLLFSWPGGSEKLSVDHEGPGKPWLFMQSLAAIPLKEPVSTGFKIKKTYTAVDEKVPGVWSVGDVVRVRLDLEAQTDMTWVAVTLLRGFQGVLLVRAERQMVPRIYGAPQYARPFSPAQLQGRGPLRAGDVRGDAEPPLCRGVDLKRILARFTGFSLAAIAIAGWLWSPLPSVAVRSFSDVRAAYASSDGLLLDRNGVPIQELRVDFQGRSLEWTPLGEVSPPLLRAVVASEDKRFYRHSGVDGIALFFGALKSSLGRGRRGASTITMQVAAMTNGTARPETAGRTLAQKWRQMRLAWAMERSWTKDQILEAYLNLVSFRGELKGIAAASRGLFQKEPSGLNTTQSLILVSLIRSPNAGMAPVTRRAVTLAAAMNEPVSPGEIASAVRIALGRPYLVGRYVSLAPHAAQYLLKGGRREARSTIDARLQSFVLTLLQGHLASVRGQNVQDGAVLVVDNRSGEILAYVGNSGTLASASCIDGIQARRQPGSALKPFLYALAIEKRIITAASLLSDTPLDIPTERGIYRPENYDRGFKGLVPARSALASSLNIPAVRVLMLAGPDAFVKKLRDLGFTELRDADYYGYSLALGSLDT
ncbi:MAG: transglycosylase domain-containing protein, partial [Syntrophorhabdales bacterium]